MWLRAWALCLLAFASPSTSLNGTVARQRRNIGDKRVVCYYTNWSVYRPGTAKFNPQNINPYLCTHLVYAFGGLTKENALKPFDKYQDIEQGGYAKFNGLKTYNKNLKTMLAIGGWNEGSARFSPMVADADRRKELVRNIIKFLRQNHFDGLDLDWEYPAFRDGGKARDRDNYATFVQELRDEFERESSKTGRTRLLLTMAVPAGIEYIDKGYDIPKLNEYLDWFNILSYDYHSAFEPAVDHHAPLYPLEPEGEYNFGSQLNIDATVKHYLKLGADRNKLVLGIPTYGRSYTLFNADSRDLGAPADGPGEQGEATREKGYLAYYEICERVKSDGWSVVAPNPDAMGPFAYKENQWVGYDDEEIARAKAKYVNDNDLGGIMFWSLDNDDFRGKCHGRPYPIIEAAKESLLATSNELEPERPSSKNSGTNQKLISSGGSNKSKNRKSRPKPKATTEVARTSSTTPAYSTTTPQPPTTPDPGSDFVCKDEGFFPHPRDCKKYFWCLDSGPSSLGIVAHQFTCPSGLVFNKISDSCDYARNVICSKKQTATTTSSSTTSSPTTQKSTTSRNRLVITAAPPRHTTTTTTTTTTEAPEEYEEEYEEEEEDPGTIKELLALIKRLGGVEQLEKQLAAQEASGKGTIKTSLYTKVLSGRAGNRFRGNSQETSTSKYQSFIRNRPAAPQSSGIQEENETSSRHQEKPQYTTIQRNRGSPQKPIDVEEIEEEVDDDEDEEEIEKPPPKDRRRPVGSNEKEYITLRRNNVRNGEDNTTPKYKNIQRTRSTTEAAVEEDTDNEDDETNDEDDSPQDDFIDKPRKYSSVYREINRGREEAEGESKTRGKVSGQTRPQYVTLTRRDKNKDSTPSDPVNTVNIDQEEAIQRTETVNTVNSPKYSEIRRRPVTSTAEPIAEEVIITKEADASLANNHPVPVTVLETDTQSSVEPIITVTAPDLTTESSSKRIEEQTSNLLERRNDPSTTITIRRRTRPPVLTTQVAPTEPTFPHRNRFRVTTEAAASSSTEPKTVRGRIRRPLLTSTTSAPVSETTIPSRRFQFAPRTKSPVLVASPRNETFTIIVPETTIPQFEPTTESTTDIEEDNEVTSEKATLPTTAYQKIRTTTPQAPPTTSTVTRVVTSITESSFTERQKIMVTKKPTFLKRVTKFTTQKTTTLPDKVVERTTRSYNPRRLTRASTSTTTEIPTTSERFQLRSKSNRFRPRTTTAAPVETTTEERRFVPKKGRARGFRKFNEDSVEVEEKTTAAPPKPRTKPQYQKSSQLRKLPKLAADLESEPSGGYFEDGDELKNKYTLGESVKFQSGKNYVNAEVLFATVPTVEEERTSAISTTKPSPVRSRATPRPTTTSQPGRVFRGRVKAVESITEHIPEDYRKKIRKVIHRRPVNSQRTAAPQAARYRVPQEEEVLFYPLESEFPEPTTTSKTTTSQPSRRSSQDYLTNLRTRTRTTSTTTESPSTERAIRRPSDRRRKFRPEGQRSAARLEASADTSDAPTSKSPQIIRRRGRPTSTTQSTSTSTTSTESVTSLEEIGEDNIDLPDLADPAVIAIHNLATVGPVPIREDPVRTAFTPASPSPFTLPRVSTPQFREITTYRQNLGNGASVATSYADFRHSTGTRNSDGNNFVTTPASARAVSESLDTPSIRNEVVIAPRRIEHTTRPPVQFSEVVISPRPSTTTTARPPVQYSEVVISNRPQTTKRPSQRKLKPFSKVPRPGVAQQAISKPEQDYEYYDEDPLADVPPSALKVKVHSDGYIECLDQGNFPHPFSCKKFISCAKMENTELLGWEYTCPKHLSFDPVGGICNWSAGLGCQH